MINVTTAWKDKKAKKSEWLRDEESAKKGQTRVEEAEFGSIGPHPDDPELGEVAMFYSNKSGKRYDIAARLAPTGMEGRQPVKLTVLGCCSIVGIDVMDKKPQKAKAKKAKTVKKRKSNK